jgi:hypothetical protein
MTIAFIVSSTIKPSNPELKNIVFPYLEKYKPSYVYIPHLKSPYSTLYSMIQDFNTCIILPPLQTKKYGRLAPLLRIDFIASTAKLLVTIWDGKSHGVRRAVSTAQAMGRRCEEHIIKL